MKWRPERDWTDPKRIGPVVRCALLDPDGRQCAAVATHLSVIHPDGEGFDPAWYAVPFCDRHIEERDRTADYRDTPRYRSVGPRTRRKRDNSNSSEQDVKE